MCPAACGDRRGRAAAFRSRAGGSRPEPEDQEAAMFTHSQRRRAVLEAMRRVLASVLVLQLLTGPVVQGHPHPVPKCEQVISTHDVAEPGSKVTVRGDGCGQAGNDQPGQNLPEEPDARFATP